MGPLLRDNLGALSFFNSQVLVWGKHTINLLISKVKITKFQRGELLLVSMNCVHPFREVHSDHIIVEVSGYSVSIHCAA
jgi:hypothetical protein